MDAKKEHEPKSLNYAGSYDVYIDDSVLSSVNQRYSLRKYITMLISRRHFMLADSKSRALNGAKNTFLGRAWLFLDPLFQVGIYAVVFGLILHSSRGIDNFVGFLALGVTTFQSITRGYNVGVGLIQRSRALIKSFQFPRASLVISRVFETWLDCSIPILVAMVIAIIFQGGTGLSWRIALLPAVYALILIFNTGLAFIFARVTAFVPDLKSVINLCTRGLFFVSGIFYSIDRFANGGLLPTLMKYNPIYQFLMGMRSTVLQQHDFGIGNFLYLTAWSLGIFVFGFLFFWRSEGKYAFVK